MSAAGKRKDSTFEMLGAFERVCEIYQLPEEARDAAWQAALTHPAKALACYEAIIKPKVPR